VSSLIDYEQGKAIVKEYDKFFLFFMLLKCYYPLHPLVETERDVVEQKVEKEKTLDIFEMIGNISEPTMELVNKELMIFKCYKADVKDIKCPLHWWEKYDNMFLTIGFCAKQILGIVGSQIETKKIFSFPGILTKLKRCHL